MVIIADIKEIDYTAMVDRNICFNQVRWLKLIPQNGGDWNSCPFSEEELCAIKTFMENSDNFDNISEVEFDENAGDGDGNLGVNPPTNLRQPLRIILSKDPKPHPRDVSEISLEMNVVFSKGTKPYPFDFPIVGTVSCI